MIHMGQRLLTLLSTKQMRQSDLAAKLSKPGHIYSNQWVYEIAQRKSWHAHTLDIVSRALNTDPGYFAQRIAD